MTKKEIFKAIFDNNRTIEGIIKEIDSLREEKELIRNQPRRPHHKRVIKDINHRIAILNRMKQQLPPRKRVGVRRNKWGLEIPDTDPKQKTYQEKKYTYSGSNKKKTGKHPGNGEKKKEKMQKVHNTKSSYLRAQARAERKRKKLEKREKKRKQQKRG